MGFDMGNKPRAGTPVEEADTFAAAKAVFLRDLAAGTYDREVAWAQRMLGFAAKYSRTAALILTVFNLWLWANRVTAPGAPVVADGKGGFVPVTNSEYDPETGVFKKGPFSWLSGKK